MRGFCNDNLHLLHSGFAQLPGSHRLSLPWAQVFDRLDWACELCSLHPLLPPFPERHHIYCGCRAIAEGICRHFASFFVPLDLVRQDFFALAALVPMDSSSFSSFPAVASFAPPAFFGPL